MKITKYEPEDVLNNGNITCKILRVAAYCRVSTDNEDQINSYHSMINYYTDMIERNPEWKLFKIYADEGLTGTKTQDRVAFTAMIADALEGNIDLIITKSIARFARNTVDTLNYVRQLKAKGIPVIFENEKINTMSMDGEFLLTILASVAQQEVENTSANVKKGLYAKMSRGELVGFNNCIGYDYNINSKNVVINLEEANIVHFIFDEYVSGKGGTQIARDLNALGLKTKKGNKWTPSGVIGVVRNEKYVGDLKQGKTYTVDPISKRRLKNNNQSIYYVAEGHHEPIIDRDQYEKCQEILNKRSYKRKDKTRDKYMRQYAFSSIIKCGFCGKNFSRRCWHSGTDHEKIVWQCVTNTKKGKEHCPHAKGIPESIIEEMFVKSYNMFCGDNKESLDEFLDNVKKAIGKSEIEAKLAKFDKAIKANIAESEKILELYLDDSIDKGTYKSKYHDLKAQRDVLEAQREDINFRAQSERTLEDKIQELRQLLQHQKVLKNFSREVFECIVDKIIIGDYGEDGTPRPYNITFIYKTGFKDTYAVKSKKCSNNTDTEKKSVPENESTHVESIVLLQKQNYTKVLSFQEKADFRHFNSKGIGKETTNKTEITVSVAVQKD